MTGRLEFGNLNLPKGEYTAMSDAAKHDFQHVFVMMFAKMDETDNQHNFGLPGEARLPLMLTGMMFALKCSGRSYTNVKLEWEIDPAAFTKDAMYQCERFLMNGMEVKTSLCQEITDTTLSAYRTAAELLFKWHIQTRKHDVVPALQLLLGKYIETAEVLDA